jgi:hypothetical protein
MDVFSAVAMTPDDLFPDETLIRSIGTNVLLPRYPKIGVAGAKPWVLGSSAPERVLGVLHLTNYRLKFKPAERPTPVFSIFLPDILDVRNVSWLLVRKFRITVKAGTHIDFIRWSIQPVIEVVNKARVQAKSLDWDTIAANVAASESKTGDWQVA